MLQVLANASKENSGIPDLTKLLASNPSMGQIWTEGPGGYALKDTHREELPDGGQRIVVITDRPIGALNPPGPWKAEGQTTDVAPFTVIEMHVTKDGKGEGKMSLGVPFKIEPGDQTVDLSNYAAAPVTIRNVQLRRGAGGGYLAPAQMADRRWQMANGTWDGKWPMPDLAICHPCHDRFHDLFAEELHHRGAVVHILIAARHVRLQIALDEPRMLESAGPPSSTFARKHAGDAAEVRGHLRVEMPLSGGSPRK